MNCINSANGEILASEVKVNKTFLSRLKGLMFDKSLPEGHAVLLEPCNSIHTMFMRFKIDVIFLSSKNQVVRVISSMSPWRMTRIYGKAKKTLELNGGALKDRVKEGDVLEFK